LSYAGQHGRAAVFRARQALFGARLPALLNELADTLVADIYQKYLIMFEGGGS
jgi:hypothetical protein